VDHRRAALPTGWALAQAKFDYWRGSNSFLPMKAMQNHCNVTLDRNRDPMIAVESLTDARTGCKMA